MLKNIIFIFVIFMIIGINNVYAYELSATNVDGYYIKYDGIKTNVKMFREKETNEVLFCMKPYGLVIDDKLTYKYVNSKLFPELDRNTLYDIQDLLYLGYGYYNHTDIKWYLLSQFMLFKKLGYDVDMVDEYDNNIIDIYIEDYKEYIKLINDYNILPSYFANTININYGENYELNDLNEVEENFELLIYAFVRVKEKNGKNYLTGTRPYETKLGCYHKNQPVGYNKIYYATNYAFINNTTSSKRTYEVNVKIHGGKIKIVETDKNNKPVANSRYFIYNLNDKLISAIITKANGEGITSYLPYDNYYLIKENSSDSKILVDFVDYGITEIEIQDDKVKDKFNSDVIEEDEEKTEITDDESDNLIEEEVIVEDIKKEENIIHNVIEEEFDVPKTSLDLTKYIVLLFLLLFGLGVKICSIKK